MFTVAMGSRTCQTLAVMLLMLMFAAPPLHADRRAREDAAENIRYAIRDKEQKLANLRDQRAKYDPALQKQQQAYEKTARKIESLNAELDETRQKVADAGAALQQVTQRIKQQIINNPQYVNQQRRADELRDKLERVKAEAAEPIKQSDEYQRIIDEVESNQAKLELMRESDAVEPLELQAMAIEIQGLQSEAQQLIDRKLQQNQQVVNARSQYEEAHEYVLELREQLTQRLDENAERQSAEKAVADARKRIAELQRELAAAKRENRVAKARYAKVQRVVGQIDQRIEREQRLLKGLHEELKAIGPY